MCLGSTTVHAGQEKCQSAHGGGGSGGRQVEGSHPVQERVQSSLIPAGVRIIEPTLVDSSSRLKNTYRNKDYLQEVRRVADNLWPASKGYVSAAGSSIGP